jgi:MraZ protein
VGLFLSTIINKVDKKGRVSVPSGFRSALAHENFQGIVLFRSYSQNAIEGVGMSAMETMSERMDNNFAFFSDEHDEFATALFGDSVQLGFDGEGRIMLPKDFADYAGITDQVAFVGLGQKFQLWSPEKLEARKTIARKAVQSKKMTLPKGGQE